MLSNALFNDNKRKDLLTHTGVLQLFQFNSFDNIILQLGTDLYEIGAVGCHAHEQVLVIFRMLLCIAQYLIVRKIELDQIAAVFKEGPDHGGKFSQTFFVFHGPGRDSHVQDTAVGELDLIELGHRIEGSCGAGDVAALALQLENMGREKNLTQGKQTLAQLEAEISNLTNYVNQLDWATVG